MRAARCVVSGARAASDAAAHCAPTGAVQEERGRARGAVPVSACWAHAMVPRLRTHAFATVRQNCCLSLHAAAAAAGLLRARPCAAACARWRCAPSHARARQRRWLLRKSPAPWKNRTSKCISSADMPTARPCASRGRCRIPCSHRTWRLGKAHGRVSRAASNAAAAEAAAEAPTRRVVMVAVHPDAAALERAADAVLTVDVARPDARPQAVGGVIRQRDRLCLVFEGGDRKHRPEDFVSENLHVVGA